MTETAIPIYEAGKGDITKAGEVFTKAFAEDPVWGKVLSGATYEQQLTYFRSPAIYCEKYGRLVASSQNGEGMAGVLPGKYADMSFWRMLRCSVRVMPIRIGLKRLMRMKKIFDPLGKMRHDIMKERTYIYLQILGVDPEYQGQGYGSKILRSLIAQYDEAGLPIYLETETEKNIRLYEHFGFTVAGEIQLPILELPMWGMLREPER